MAEENRTKEQKPRKPRKKRSTGMRIGIAFLYVLCVIGVSALLATLGWKLAGDLLALDKEYTSVIITITEDMFTEKEVKGEDGEMTTISRAKMGEITDQLKENGLIDYGFLFRTYAWFSKADRKIAPGTYELNTQMDYRALITNMSSSSSTRQTVDVTIPEGYTLDQIFQLLEENGVSTTEKLTDTAANWPYKWDFLQDIPLGDYHRLEGYLFPDTYTFYQGEDPKYVLNKMLLRFDEKMSEYYEQFGEDSTYSLHDIVTIASMIEKETDGHDYRTISSVLYNRLTNLSGETVGYLQIDATLVYINGGKMPTEADKEIDSPYNTYMYQGLPAGPISNPGMASLYAAMNPENTKYYFYALNPATNRHEFSQTFAQHQAKLDSYAKANG